MDEENKKYNKNILVNEIAYRLNITIFLVCIIFLVSVFKQDILVGAILSLIVTALYLFVDLYLKLFNAIDAQEIQFTLEIERISNKYNQGFNKLFDNSEKIKENFYKYIYEIFSFVYYESPCTYNQYSLTKKYNEINIYVKQVYIKTAAIQVLEKANKLEKNNIIEIIKQLLLREEGNGLKGKIEDAIQKAEIIIGEKVEDINVDDIEYFLIEDERGDIRKSSERSITNKINFDIHELLNKNGDIETLKKFTKDIFWDSFRIALDVTLNNLIMALDVTLNNLIMAIISVIIIFFILSVMANILG